MKRNFTLRNITGILLFFALILGACSPTGPGSFNKAAISLAILVRAGGTS